MTGVEQNRTIEREIACYNLRSVIESRHPLCGVLLTPSNRWPLWNTDASSERYWTFLILTTVEPLPVWIMFIDRIIDRICLLSVTLTTELLNPAQIEPCCRVVVACDSLWQPNIPPSNGVHSVDALVLYGNAIYFVWASLFNGIKSDGVTIRDAPPPGRRLLNQQNLTHHRIFCTCAELTHHRTIFKFWKSPYFFLFLTILR